MYRSTKKAILTGMFGIAMLGLAAATWAQTLDLNARMAFNIPAQPLEAALLQLSKQASCQLAISADSLPAGSAPKVAGKMSVKEAVELLLSNTGLQYKVVGDRTLTIVPRGDGKTTNESAGQPLRVAHVYADERAMQKVQQMEAPEQSADKAGDVDSKGTPEILVEGKRTLNTDIRRTEDDPQPYVVFGREEVQRSQALNLEEFLRTRLPMNTASSTSSQTTGGASTASSINLRGLGENQTLILVDGRRIPSRSSAGSPQQPDLNGIPLSAIERIEVLPSTASGIYGGSATGGVVNIILRRDFSGLEVLVNYANTFDTDVGNTRLDASAGFSLEDGRTQIMIAATRSEANSLLIGDRDFAMRAIALQRANNPTNFAALTTPPLGATVNIRGVGGALLELKPEYGGTALGAAFTHIPLGYAGPASDSGAALVANAGQYNLDLPAGVNGLERGLVAAPSIESVSLNARREFGDRLEAFLDLSRLGNRGISFNATVPSVVTSLPATAPNNPFRQAIAVSFPTPSLSFESHSESTTIRTTSGLILRLPQHWTGEASIGWNRSRLYQSRTGTVLDTGATAAGTGTLNTGLPGPAAPGQSGTRPALNVLQEGNAFPIDFSPYLLSSPNVFDGPYDTILANGTVRLSGPVMSLPGGALTLSALFERREETMEGSFQQAINATSRMATYSYFPERSQDVDSYYMEARVPLVSRRNASSFVRELELQASIRRDEYKTRSFPTAAMSVPSRDGPLPTVSYTTARLGSSDYTLGLRYAPLKDLTLRASFGTGFLPPSVQQIASREFPGTTSSLGATDPKRGDTPIYAGVPYTLLSGGSPTLKAESSESRSAGVIFTPRFAPGMRLSIDYTRIEKVDEIQTPSAQFILANEDILPGRIARGSRSSADIIAGYEGGPITSLDLTLINIAATSVEAFDVRVDYALETARFGGFSWYAIATYQPHYLNQALPTAAAVESAGFAGGPLEWRGNLGLDWTRGPLALSWNMQYYDSYWVYTALALPLTPAQVAARATSVLNQGSATIPRQIYHDLIATYRFDAAARFAGELLTNSEISLGIQNLFGKSPPILASVDPTSAGYSTYGDPRLRRYTLSFRKSFGL